MQIYLWPLYQYCQICKHLPFLPLCVPTDRTPVTRDVQVCPASIHFVSTLCISVGMCLYILHNRICCVCAWIVMFQEMHSPIVLVSPQHTKREREGESVWQKQREWQSEQEHKHKRQRKTNLLKPCSLHGIYCWTWNCLHDKNLINQS